MKTSRQSGNGRTYKGGTPKSRDKMVKTFSACIPALFILKCIFGLTEMKRFVLKIVWLITASLLVVFYSVLAVNSEEVTIMFREDFNDLENWRPLYFPKIKEHTDYSIVKEGEEAYLKAESNASASGIIYKKEFDVYEYPKVRWRWKISNVYEKGDAGNKSGDDYPVRIYIVFKYDPENASFGQRIKYSLAKIIYGEYPPHSSLNYIWANRRHKESFITNPYADEAKMIILQTGAENAGKWKEEEVDIKEDYRKAFGALPPSTASLAIMNDSDDTGESSVSFIDYIEVFN